MNSFKDYISEKYPSYAQQKNLLEGRKLITNNLDAENVEKSLKNAENLQIAFELKQANEIIIKKKHESKKKFLPKLKIRLTSRRRQLPKDTMSMKSMIETSKTKRETGLEGYENEDGKAYSPVNWKRPVSNTAILIKQMMDYREDTKLNEELNQGKRDKEIFFEAIYREDIAGQIFMKFIKNKNKKVFF